MIDINELRQSAQAATPGPWYVGSGTYEGRNIYSTASVTDGEGFTYQPVVATAEDNEVACWDANARLIAAANPAVISELLDRLEAAESECLEQARLNGMGGEREAALMAKLEATEEDRSNFLVEMGRLCAQCDALRLRIKAAEKERDALRAKITEMERQEPAGTLHDDGCFVWRETAPHQSNYAGWKMALYALPGARPAPSVPDDWLRAIDEALVTAHIGVANAHDTYEQAKAKLDNLIGFLVDVATDPAVNGGWKLVPIEPTPTMITAALESSHAINAHRAEYCYRAMLAAAPEAKP